MIVNCISCRKDFECTTRKYNQNTKRGHNIFCSHKCYNKYKTENNSVKCKCANCNKEIVKNKSSLVQSKTGNLYCSKKCAVSNNNRLFKNGKSHANYTIGKSSYRKKALKEESFCRDCGINDIRVLQVHHIDKNRNNNEKENLVVLCANCHLIRHCKI